MEYFSLLTIFAYLCLALVASHAALSPEAYWNSALPNTSMPQAVRDLLSHDGKQDVEATLANPGRGKGIVYTSWGDSKDLVGDHDLLSTFFLESDLKRDEKMTLDFTENSTATSVSFLPREEAAKIPFTSAKLPEILKHLSVNPNSVEAETMKNTIKACEEPGIEGEEKYCATSLESMVDFVTAKLGENIDVFSTEVEKKTGLQEYVIEDVRNVSKDAVVVCHTVNYAYAVFYCHKTRTPSRIYKVSMIGADGTRVKAVAACHVDTSAWNPKHLAFQQLNVEPGTICICHFHRKDDVDWVSK